MFFTTHPYSAIYCLIFLLVIVESQPSEDEREVQRQIVNQNFIKAGLSEAELNEINEIVENLGINELQALEDAVMEYATRKLTEVKREKVKIIIAELKEGLEFMKNAFGNVVGTFLKSWENKKSAHDPSEETLGRITVDEEDYHEEL